ncbi:hypothetical protein LTS18_011751, partial [Coniosporium uncinatum]
MIDVPFATADLRFTNYYMDLQLDMSPISISIGKMKGKKDHAPKFASGQPQLFIDSVRLYGMRLFGLPPAEPSYAENWDVDVGTITGDCSDDFLPTLISGVQSLAFTFVDAENALPLLHPVAIYDTTHRSSSSGSVARSISNQVHRDTPNRSPAPGSRRAPGSFSTVGLTRGTSGYNDGTLTDDEERYMRGLAPSTMAFSSPLAAPYFPLDAVQPDEQDLPSMPADLDARDDTDPDAPSFNDVQHKEFNEDLVHTSLIITADSGIQAFCSPAAIETVANLIGIVQSRDPESVLDLFQSSIMGKLLDKEGKKHGDGSAIELSLRVPYTAIRFANSFQSTAEP